MTLTSKRFESREGLQSIYTDWLQLLSCVRRQTIFQHPAWYLAFFDSDDSNDHAIEFHCIYRGEFLVAVFPLTISRRGLIRCASLPRDGGLFNSDCAISDREKKSEIWTYICQNLKTHGAHRWDVFMVRGEGALESSGIVQCLDANSLANFRVESPQRCDLIEIIDYDSAMASLKGDFRRNLKRRKRKLSDEQQAEFVCITETPMIEQAFQKFVELEQSGWKGHSETGKAEYPAPSAIGLFKWKYLFYRGLVVEFAKLGAAEICLIQAGGRLIGAQICVVLNDTSFMLRTTYDENAKRYSPGQLGIDYLYRRYAAGGRVKFLNMITDYNWHANWNPKKLRYFQLTAFNNTFLGMVLCALYGAGMLLRRILGKKG